MLRTAPPPFRATGLAGSTQSVCKIYRVDDTYFAISGIVRDAAGGFHIPEVVASGIREGGNLGAKLDSVERRVRMALLRELPRLQDRDPKGYAAVMHAKGAVTVMLVGIEAGAPAASSFSLGLELAGDAPRVTVTRDSCPGNCPSGVRAFWFGDGEAIERLRVSGKMPTLPMPELARFLIQAEIGAGIPGVAGPVDVVTLRRDGAVSMQSKAGCPVSIGAGWK